MRKKGRLEVLASRYLLWAFQGNPYPMRLFASTKNEKRADMIRYFARLARQGEIEWQLPEEEVLGFFEAEPKHGYAETLLAIEAFLLGIHELEPDQPWIAQQLELVHNLQKREREARAKVLASPFGDSLMAGIDKDPEGFAKKVREEMQDAGNS